MWHLPTRTWPWEREPMCQQWEKYRLIILRLMLQDKGIDKMAKVPDLFKTVVEVIKVNLSSQQVGLYHVPEHRIQILINTTISVERGAQTMLAILSPWSGLCIAAEIYQNRKLNDKLVQELHSAAHLQPPEKQNNILIKIYHTFTHKIIQHAKYIATSHPIRYRLTL